MSKEGQPLLPILELNEQAQAAVDDVIDVVGRAIIEAIILLSDQQIASPHIGAKTLVVFIKEVGRLYSRSPAFYEGDLTSRPRTVLTF